MNDYLFGTLKHSVGQINGKPVKVETVTKGCKSVTIVTINHNEKITFDSRSNAMRYLRNMTMDNRG